jgi:hypothetical protein
MVRNKPRLPRKLKKLFKKYFKKDPMLRYKNKGCFVFKNTFSLFPNPKQNEIIKFYDISLRTDNMKHIYKNIYC